MPIRQVQNSGLYGLSHFVSNVQQVALEMGSPCDPKPMASMPGNAMTIVSVVTNEPLQDGRQSERALAIRRGLQRMFFEMKCATVPELTLANGRRADLVALCPKGRLTIVEIKSSVEDYRADGKWSDYCEHCDAFVFATLPDVPQSIFPQGEGLIIADRFGAELVRPAAPTNLSAARRKAVVQRFATTAAERLLRAELATDGEIRLTSL